LKILCVVPVFNEEENLNGTIDSVRKNNYGVDKFLFINSGSTDRSYNILKNSEYETINLAKNKGIGYVLIHAIDYCINNNYQVLTVIHGGNKMDTRDFKTVLSPIIHENYDCIWGSRFINDSSINMPKFRKASTPIISKFLSIFYNRQVTDATNGFRAYKIETIKKILPNYNRSWLYGYAFESFLFGKMLNDLETRSKEVPVTIKYNKETKNTKIKPILDYPSILFPFFLAKFIR
tara:strand:- start:970 stop:1674 length:705 start_codon:yes stop_codon:yes gene_type:complete